MGRRRECGKDACVAGQLHRSEFRSDGAEKSCPRCSCEAGQLVFKPCPEAFGTDAGHELRGTGIQSWCGECREWQVNADLDKAKARAASRGMKFLRTVSEVFARASRCTLPYLIRHEDIRCPVRGPGQLLGAEDGKHGLSMMVLFEREIAWMGHDEYTNLKTEMRS